MIAFRSVEWLGDHLRLLDQRLLPGQVQYVDLTDHGSGDVANKIGTYQLALAARAHGVPFYVAAPISTLDRQMVNGDAIEIEERSALEVTTIGDTLITLPGVAVRNPAFDITPAEYVTAFITEKGIVYPPYEEGLAKLFN